jgi:hypothetical protein
MSEVRTFNEPAFIARYQDTKAAAALLGFRLTIVARQQHLFLLGADERPVFTSPSLTEIEDFLHAVCSANKANTRKACETGPTGPSRKRPGKGYTAARGRTGK